MPFAKLDHGIIKSSIWSEPPATRVVWITMLAIKDENGFVSTSRSGLCRLCNVTQLEFDAAISCLESPDIESRTPDNDGRRIDKIDGGWIILNNDKYRLHDDIQRDKTRERVRKYREKKALYASNVTLHNVTNTLPSVSVSGSVSGINSDPVLDTLDDPKKDVTNQNPKRKEIQIPDHLSEIWKSFEEMRKKIRKPLTDKARELTLKELNKLSQDKNLQIKILEQSIQRSWQGVFPLQVSKSDESRTYGRL